MLKIAVTARISSLAHIEDSVCGTVIDIGPNVFVDSFVRIRPVGGLGDIVIGSDCDINSGCVLFSGNGITMGRNVLIGPNCTFAPTNHAYHLRSTPLRHQSFLPSKGGIMIEDDVWVGANTTILDGSVLRQGCVIGAGSLVRGEVEAYSINSGNPLRQHGMRR